MFYEAEKFALFVDGPNFHATARALEIDVDYKSLLLFFKSTQGRLLRANYYTLMADTDDHVAIRPLVDWMQYNGWNVTAKTAKAFEGEDGRKRVKGNTDIELAVDAIKLAPAVDHVVLASGNRDFTPLVAYLQERGKRVTVMSSIRTTPSMVADTLRRQADNFIDVEVLRTAIARRDRDGAAA